MNRENSDHDASIVPTPTLNLTDVPAGVDRRAFMMRSAVVGAAAVIAGCAPPSPQQSAAPGTAPPAPTPQQGPPLSADLDVVKKSKGPVMTTLDEFYKVGPGPSSSHTIGPMRIVPRSRAP